MAASLVALYRGRGMATNIIGVQWDVRDSAWRYVTILDLPFSLVFDTLLLPIDIHHGPYE